MGTFIRENMTRENIKPKPGLKSELGPCPAADWTQKVDWNVYLTGENGLTTHCSQIESCGVFLVNGDTLAQINLDHVSNFKEVKNVMPFFKNKPTINHEEFHYFDVPLVFYKTKYGMVLCAIGNEESADTDSGEKVATAVTRIGNFLEMCGY